MTVADRNLRNALTAAGGESWLIRWGGATANGGRIERLEAVLALGVQDADRVEIEAWIICDGERRVLLPLREASSSVCVDGNVLHVDAFGEGERLIALSLELGTGRVVYARTAILAEAGLPTGAFDPPVAERRPAKRGAATA